MLLRFFHSLGDVSGFIQQIGTPQEVFDHPVNIFVAGFIGSPQMNLFEGELQKNGGSYQIAVAGADEAVVSAVLVEAAEEGSLSGAGEGFAQERTSSTIPTISAISSRASPARTSRRLRRWRRTFGETGCLRKFPFFIVFILFTDHFIP